MCILKVIMYISHSARVLLNQEKRRGTSPCHVLFTKCITITFSANYYAKLEYHKTAQKGPQKALNFWQLSYQCFYCVCSRVCPLPVCVKPHNSSVLVMRHSNNLLGCLSHDCYYCHAN